LKWGYIMIISGVRSAESGEAVVIASENTNKRAMSEMSLVELLEGMILACDKEIASNNAKENA
jgi:hypothetical protein